jgi:arylsulfatase A-like enzyme
MSLSPRSHLSTTWAGLAAGTLMAVLISLWQYIGPLDYVGVLRLIPLFLVNFTVGIVAGVVFPVLWGRAGRRGVVLTIASAVVVVALCGYANIRRDVKVVVYVSDAVRPDHLSVYGYHRDTTPTLERLADDPGAVAFSNAIAQSTYTWGGTPAILASSYPSMNGIQRFEARLSDDITTIAEVLTEAGYSTLGISANPHVSREKNFSQGFDLFEDSMGWRGAPEADRVDRLFFHWQIRPANRKRSFAFLFVTDAHGPYSADREEVQRYRPECDLPWYRFPREVIDTTDEELRQDVVAVYDASLRFVDQALGALIDALRGEGLFSSTLLVFTSDHGEAFWERGTYGHGGKPYEEVIRIPLIMHLPSPVYFPQLRPVSKRPEWQVGQIDIMPTIMHFVRAHQEAPAIRGDSLLPYLYGRLTPPIDRGLMSEIAPANRLIRSWRQANWKFIATWASPNGEGDPGKEELFDLSRDPRELNDVAAEHPGQLERLRKELRAEVDAAQPHSVTPTLTDLSPEARKRLKAMGYLR